MNLYYIKSDRYSGEDALAVLADNIEDAAKKYRAEKVKRWKEWAEANPADVEEGDEPDESIASIIKECEVDAE